MESFYGADARSYDQSVISNPSLLHVFSAGNAGMQASTGGTYANMPGYANLTGSFKMAKNTITVGHIDSFGIVPGPSSKGPAHDGRLKPELVAFGEDGSSGAAALVSGIALMVQHAYKETFGNIIPPSSLVKAILLNSADDIDSSGIDFRSGFGSVNAYKALKHIVNGFHANSSIANGDRQDYPLTIPAGIKRVKVTLVWNDIPAAANTTKALINDLDIELENTSTGESWKPWVLSSFPHIDSLKKLPVRKKDTLNNVEQVTIDNPSPGNYLIKVFGTRVISASQSFSLAWQLDTLDTFTWYYPTGSDNIFPGDTNTIRWESNYSNVTGQLQFTTDGINLQALGDADLAKGYHQWVAPLVYSNGRLRMVVGANNFLSDTFTISSPLITKVGYHCPDSFLFYWNKVSSVSSFQVYKLGIKYLELLQTVSDTFIVLSTNASSYQYSVAPILQNKRGVKSLTFDYRFQGVDCYIKNFLVFLNARQAVLNLEIGTSYQIQSITWQKNTLNGFVDLQMIMVNGLQYNYNDAKLTNGINSYRVKIRLTTGQVIYSRAETIYFFGSQNYIVFPNPAMQSQTISIIANEANNEIVQVYNTGGIMVHEFIMDDITKLLPSARLSKGLYFIRITRNGKMAAIMKLVVY